ncbi:MAG: Uma2 family endonuclease [Kofleriaceae bacterium]|nr:Uma2 family endonuclease [Kofleriaceae bacterium]MCL4226469.1 Uma2 family endonuclease [Myxococcales bacterium]
MDPAQQRATYAEYLAREARGDLRHEYVSGEVRAMSGGTIEHGRLISRLTVLLGRALEGRPCVVMPGSARTSTAYGSTPSRASC